jgi:proliferating cell nuclear antigen PCNA
MSKLVRIETDHSYELKIMFEVLKEVFDEIKIDFLRSDTQTTEPIKKQQTKNTEDQSDTKSSKTKKKKNIEEDETEKKPAKKGAKNLPVKETKKKSKKQDDDDENNEDDSQNVDDEESEETLKDTKKKSTTGGIRIMAIDDNELLLIYVKLNPDQFLDFYVKSESYSIGLDLIEFHKFVKTIDKDSIMNIHIDKDDDQNIIFGLKNAQKGISSEYTQKLLDINGESNQLPIESNFHMSVIMETCDFKKICTELSQFSEYVEITCTNKEITFKCRGDQNKLQKSFENSEKGVRIIALKKDGPPIFQAIYNLKHLVTFGRCTNLCSEMQLYLRNDYPLFIYFTIGDLGKLLVGLSPVDGKIVKKDKDYNEQHDEHYQSKKIIMKT